MQWGLHRCQTGGGLAPWKRSRLSHSALGAAQVRRASVTETLRGHRVLKWFLDVALQCGARMCCTQVVKGVAQSNRLRALGVQPTQRRLVGCWRSLLQVRHAPSRRAEVYNNAQLSAGRRRRGRRNQGLLGEETRPGDLGRLKVQALGRCVVRLCHFVLHINVSRKLYTSNRTQYKLRRNREQRRFRATRHHVT